MTLSNKERLRLSVLNARLGIICVESRESGEPLGYGACDVLVQALDDLLEQSARLLRETSSAVEADTVAVTDAEGNIRRFTKGMTGHIPSEVVVDEVDDVDDLVVSDVDHKTGKIVLESADFGDSPRPEEWKGPTTYPSREDVLAPTCPELLEAQKGRNRELALEVDRLESEAVDLRNRALDAEKLLEAAMKPDYMIPSGRDGSDSSGA